MLTKRISPRTNRSISRRPSLLNS